MDKDSKHQPQFFGRTNRRTFLAGATALGASAVILGAPRISRAAGEVKVLNWQGYGTDTKWAVEAFQKATGNTVVHDYYTSEPEMLTKLRTNPGGYDVVLTNCAWNGVARQADVIQPIDTSKLSNWADLNPAFRDSELMNDGGKTYAVAWAWGMNDIAYSTDVFKTAPDSIEVMWDPKLAKRVALRDDATEAVNFAAIATGQDMNHPADLDKVKAKLMALKPNVATLYSSEDEWFKQMAAKAFDISFLWGGSSFRANRIFHLPVSGFVPKEGAIGWFDGLAIAKGAPNPDGAAAFINYMVDPSFFVKWFNEEGAAVPTNSKALAATDDSNPAKAFYSDQSMVKRLQFMAPLSDDEKQKYSDLWTEVKTAFAQ